MSNSNTLRDKAEYHVLYQPLIVQIEQCFKKNMSSAILSTTNPSWTPAEENPGLCCKKTWTDAWDTAQNILSLFILTYFLVTRNYFICRVSFLVLNFNHAFSFRSKRTVTDFNVLYLQYPLIFFSFFYVVSFNLLFIFSSFVHCNNFNGFSCVLSLLSLFILPILHQLTSEEAF
jgi:hypothetical protein